MASQNRGLRGRLAGRALVGLSRCTGHCGGSLFPRLPSKVIDYAGADCCNDEKLFCAFVVAGLIRRRSGRVTRA